MACESLLLQRRHRVGTANVSFTAIPKTDGLFSHFYRLNFFSNRTVRSQSILSAEFKPCSHVNKAAIFGAYQPEHVSDGP